MKKRYAFVAGCARSGTTAITRLLNQHPLIALGLERYKFYANRENIKKVTPMLFEKHRFFDFRKSDTNILPDSEIRWKNFYKQIESKFDQANIIGDKYPLYYDFYKEMTNAFCTPKWIFMMRNVEDVAVSYNKRAKDTNDAWPLHADYRRAVRDWNRSLEKTWHYVSMEFDNVFFCKYEEIFSYNPRYLQCLLDFLGVDFDPKIQNAYYSITKDWDQRIRNKETLNKLESDYVRDQANFFLANKLTDELAGNSNFR